MQAIETKYICPTNVRGSRIKAECSAGSIILDYDHGLNLDENHQAAAYALCRKMQWLGALASGTLKSGNYVHVFIERN